jgi:DNA modification methylase
MVLAGSAPGDIVLDPFSGTATVGFACNEHQRYFVGLELNPQYIELAKGRW